MLIIQASLPDICFLHLPGDESEELGEIYLSIPINVHFFHHFRELCRCLLLTQRAHHGAQLSSAAANLNNGLTVRREGR